MKVAHDVPSSRREYKYLLPPHQLEDLRHMLKGAASLDKFAGPDNRYVVDSLYYDTPTLDLYRANAREQVDRYKLRIRHYPSSPGAPVFLELKRRTGDAIRKRRIAVEPSQWRSALHGLDNAVGRRVFRDRLLPTLRVRYLREAWVSDLHPYARLSIDGAIEAAIVDRPYLGELHGWRPVDTPVDTSTTDARLVVELKFTGPAPTFFTDVVQRLNLQRQAFGKYIRGIRNLGHGAAWGHAA